MRYAALSFALAAGAFLAPAQAETSGGTASFLLHSPQESISALFSKAREALRVREGAEQGLRNLLRARASFKQKQALDFQPEQLVGDRATTVRFTPVLGGVPVLGRTASVHFDESGNVHDVTLRPIDTAIDLTPRVSPIEVARLVRDRYQAELVASEAPALRVFRDFQGKTRLVYLTASEPAENGPGLDLIIDAHSGETVAEAARGDAFFADSGNRTIFNARTTEARRKSRLVPVNSSTGSYAPAKVDLNWYTKVLENDRVLAREAKVQVNGTEIDLNLLDDSVVRANENASRIYAYFVDTFGRKSYDNKDAVIQSVVHVGYKFSQAYWAHDRLALLYGDGDGQYYKDFTLALDVAGHEFTHAVIRHERVLFAADEPGALHESYADFFGKMVAHTRSGNGAAPEHPSEWKAGLQAQAWDVGAAVIGPANTKRAVRNMLEPEQFGQPGTNDSPLRWKTKKGHCSPQEDYCGIHANSGIPNRAAALIVLGIGKDKAEQLYYRVLTQRLSIDSDFADARLQTEKECVRMFGADSTECEAVTYAFDTVKM